MSITVYGLKQCDSCRRARGWLDAAGIEYRFVEVRDPALDRQQIANWLATLGPGRLINRRSTTWRGLDDAQKALADDAATALDLLDTQRSLIKRPLLEAGDTRLAGFDAATWTEALAVEHAAR